MIMYKFTYSSISQICTSPFSQFCFLFKDFLGLIPGPKQNIAIWHHFEDSYKVHTQWMKYCSPVIFVCFSDCPYAFEAIQLYVP